MFQNKSQSSIQFERNDASKDGCERYCDKKLTTFSFGDLIQYIIFK